MHVKGLRRRRRFRIDLDLSIVRELIPHRPLSRRGWNPIKLAYKLAGWPAQLATSAFNQLGQYVNSPGHRAHCYTELTISSLAVAATMASTHFAYPRRDDQAELAYRLFWMKCRLLYKYCLLTLQVLWNIGQTELGYVMSIFHVCCLCRRGCVQRRRSFATTSIRKWATTASSLVDAWTGRSWKILRWTLKPAHLNASVCHRYWSQDVPQSSMILKR